MVGMKRDEREGIMVGKEIEERGWWERRDWKEVLDGGMEGVGREVMVGRK